MSSVTRNTPNTEQTELLHDLYYNQNVIFGRDRLYKYVQEFYPEYNISRRMVWNFLSKQETHQRFSPVKRTKKKTESMGRTGQGKRTESFRSCNQKIKSPQSPISLKMGKRSSNISTTIMISCMSQGFRTN